MKTFQAITCVLFVLLLATGLFGQSTSPKETVAAFYKDNFNSQTFNRRWINSRKKWLSPRFYNIFLEELREEQAHLKLHPTDKPYFGDGISFAPRQESCTTGRAVFRKYAIQTPVMRGNARAEVPVRFFYPKPCTMDAITYKVKLIKIGRAWIIDDLLYGDGSSLGADMKEHQY